MSDATSRGARHVPIEMSGDEFRRLGHALVDRLAAFLDDLPQRRVAPGDPPDDVRRILGNATLPIDDKICLTATVDILKAIANGNGPKHAILALGYAGWGPGQLENEIQGNGWLHCDADPDLIFGDDVDEKYARALAKIGIDLGMLSNEAGHA